MSTIPAARPMPGMYAYRDGSGLFSMRQTRYQTDRQNGREHPHDVCAIARSLGELRLMCAPHWPQADYSIAEAQVAALLGAAT